MKLFGLIGKSLSHSFSRKYFTEKFEKEGLTDHAYELFELSRIGEIENLFLNEDLSGLNVTIPYKTEVLPYLDELDDRARRIGAVNVIAFRDGLKKGYNSDYFGFRTSLETWAGTSVRRMHALVLGTGGASKAVRVVLEDLSVPYQSVSRSAGPGRLTYEQLNEDIIRAHRLIINTTPLGMSPDTGTLPELPYGAIGPNHYLYDLVYNPETTGFMKKGMEAGARTMNGLKMLHLQAEASWTIWNE